MFTGLRKLSLVLLPWLALGLVRPVHAEPPVDQSFVLNALQNLDSGDDTAIMQLGEQLNANPDYFRQLEQQFTPPPVDLSQGRKKKANGAQAMAIFGAVMAFASCAMMMAAAAKMPPGPERTMMMAQALQQCGQAAQNLANANQNEDAGNAVTSQPAQMPMIAKTPTLQVPRGNSPRIPTFGGNNDPDPASPSNLPPVGDIKVPDLKSPTKTGGTTVTAKTPDDFDFPADTFDNAPKQLPVLQEAALGVNEGAGLGSSDPLGGSVFRSSLQSKLDGGVPETKEGATGPEGPGDRVRGGTAESPPTSSGGADSSSSGDGKDKFNLANLLKGMNGEEESAGPGTEVFGVLPKNKKDPKNRLNIFEYASFRYRRLTYEEGRIEPRLLGKRPAPGGPTPADLQAKLEKP